MLIGIYSVLLRFLHHDLKRKIHVEGSIETKTYSRAIGKMINKSTERAFPGKYHDIKRLVFTNVYAVEMIYLIQIQI
jgi:hypothetical protein